MKKLLALLLFAVAPCFAQNLNHVSLTGSAAGFTGGGSSTASTEGVSYQFTSHVSLGFQNIQVPNLGGFDLGIAEYAVPLSTLLGTKLSSDLTFSPDNIVISFVGGAGEFASTVGAKNSVAETAGAFISLPTTVSSNGVTIGPIVQLQWVHSSSSGNGFVMSPSAASIAAGLNVTF